MWLADKRRKAYGVHAVCIGEFKMIEPGLMIGTIVMILLMGAVSMIAVIFAARKPTSINKGMRTMSILMVCYMLAAFMKYYLQICESAARWIMLAGCLSDVLYFVFIIGWFYVIGEFCGHMHIFSMRKVTAITVLCGVCAELIVIFGSSYDYDLDMFIVGEGFWKDVLLIVNGAYAIAIIGIAAVQLVYAVRTIDRGYKRNGVLFFSGMLILYMIWILIFDYGTVDLRLQDFLDVMIIDPLFIVYCLLAAAIICFFFVKDPLELFSVQDEKKQEEQLKDFAASNGLTRRETEVMELVCAGMSNPDIADKLCISEYTVKRHLNNIFQKAEVSSRYELISKVLKG